MSVLPIETTKQVMERTIYERLVALANEFDVAVRTGADTDEPEGARVITISDTAARFIADFLRGVAQGLEVGQ
jgi:hypothetical protein